MKKNVDISKASRLINCGMVILVSCAYKDKKNITTCAWHMPISKTPPIVAVALAKKHFSSELIRKSAEFVVNIPEWNLLDKVMTCGRLTGFKADKFKEAGLSPGEVLSLKKAPLISECAGAIECALSDIKDIGDHYVFFGQVISAWAEEEKFSHDFWNTGKAEFIFHLGSKYFFKSAPFREYKS